MVLTTAQTTSFFDNTSQLDIPKKTVLELVNKGISTVYYLSKFYKETIGQIAYNLLWPPYGAPFIFGAKS